MRPARVMAAVLAALYITVPVSAATFGTVAAPAGGASYSDIVLDQTRSRLYLVNSTSNLIDVYAIGQKGFLSSIATDAEPVAAAMSADGKFLYVTTYTTATVDVIDLTAGIVENRISLPSNPEGIAIGGDGRVLISAVAATGVTGNTLLIYDPVAGSLNGVPVAPPAPASPAVPTPTSPVFITYRGHLLASPDGKYIVGLNGISTTTIALFVYEVASGTVLRSREVANLSSVLSISPDSTEFMAGSTLFSTQTLQVLAQENAANAPFAFQGTGTAAPNFTTQANQGGSVFSPDGTVLYAGFNVAASGAANSNVLLFNDPNNLLIQLGLQLPENLVGKMVIDSAGANVYALSASGFTILPVSTYRNSPLAQPSSQVVLLMTDQCGVYSSLNSVADSMNNAGKGKFTVSVTPATTTTTTVGPGGAGGAFGPGGGTITTTTTTATNAPSTSVNNGGTTPTITFKFNPAATTNPGTTGPADFVVQSTEAINIPGNIHTFQNNRSSESQGAILPVQINASAGEGLTDLVLDPTRHRIYIANAGMNRIEIYDMTQQAFLTPIKVGQLPQAMAMGTDGNTLYVANTGGESISTVDLTKGAQTGIIPFPALPFNALVTLSTPQTIAASINGPQFVMSDGSLWHITGGQALPRTLNPAVFGTAKTIAGGTPTSWGMAASPDGEYILLVTGAGVGYLYNYTADDFTLTKQIHTTPLTGYSGPVTAGPGGTYFSVGGTLLNASLTEVAGGTTGTSPSGRQVAAVTAVSATQVAMFTLPTRASATATVTDAGEIEIFNPNTGSSAGPVSPTLEGPPSVVIGTTRVSAFPRTMAIDTTGGNAYVLTATGLSIVPLVTTGSTAAQLKPSLNPGGAVSLADYTPGLAAGGLVTLFGSNFGSLAVGTTSPLPASLGGTCVTLNGSPMPLDLVSPGQINAAIPPSLAAGKYPLVIHSLTNKTASASTSLSIAKYAPAIFSAYINGQNQAAILHLDGTFVTPDSPTARDETLMIFATGLGPTKGGTVASGVGAPTSPLAAICSDQTGCDGVVEVFFGPQGDTRAPVIVEWAGLAPGLVGVYQINVYVPGTHISGNAVPVSIKVGGVSSSLTGPVAPTVAVD